MATNIRNAFNTITSTKKRRNANVTKAMLEKLQSLDQELHTKWLQKKEILEANVYYEHIQTENEDGSKTEADNVSDTVPEWLLVYGWEYSELLEDALTYCLNKPRATSVSDSGHITQRSSYDEYLIALTGYARMFNTESANKHFGGNKVVTCNGLFDIIRNEPVNYFKDKTGDFIRSLCEQVSNGNIDAQEHSAVTGFKDVMMNMMMAVSMAQICVNKDELLEDLKLPDALLNINKDNAINLLGKK